MNRTTARYNTVRHIMLVLALLVGTLWPATASTAVHVAHLHPLVAQLASESPEQIVAVIVQKADKTGAAEQIATALGGQITRDLSLINAFVVKLPARAARELAASPSVRWVSLDAHTVKTGETASLAFSTWASEIGDAAPNTFVNADNIVSSPFGPDGVFGSGADQQLAVTGFSTEVTPGYHVVKVEVVLQAYVATKLDGGQDLAISVLVNGVKSKKTVLNHKAFQSYLGEDKAGSIYVDVTKLRSWQWSDFENDLQVVIDQAKFKSKSVIYYDAVGLRITSELGVDNASHAHSSKLVFSPIDTSRLKNAYNFAVRAPEVWNEAPAYLQGQGMTVAIVDSGVVKNKDIGGKVIASANFNDDYHDSTDRYGHGTFVAAIIAGDGKHQKGERLGIAPKANILNVRISDDQGMGRESDVVAALQWILDHKAQYNIRVVNLSLNSSIAHSYHTSPMAAAVEVLWFNGIVVVVSAGNNGTGTLYPPANDPFVITVGATDDKGTPGLSDDGLASFSAYGVTEAGVTKPELVAPGKNIIALLPKNNKVTVGKQHPDNSVNKDYFRMSGTSMSAPMVSGAVALLLQDEPNLTPDQVKYRLMATANKNWPGYNAAKAGAGYLDIYAAVHGNTLQSANTGLAASQLLWTGSAPVNWGSVNWESVNWESVNWESVNWESVNWESVNWESDYWGP